MSYPLLPYTPNNGAMIEQQFNRPNFDGNQIGNEILGPLFGLANQLIGEILRNGPGIDGISSMMMGIDPNNPQMKIIGISSMNVTQIARGPDGRPHVVQAHNERRIGPGGIWQTKKTLRDPNRGIDKMQVGYFDGDREEIIERRFDPSTRQYQEDVQQRVFAPNQPNFSHQRPIQSQPAIQRPLALPAPQQYRYHQRQQQQFPSYAQQRPQLRPTAPIYPYI